MDDMVESGFSSKERLEFLVKFVQMDLDALRPGSWMNLRDDLDNYLRIIGAGPSDLVLTEIEEPLPKDYPEEGFRTLQVDVRKLLEQASRIAHVELGPGVTWKFHDPRFSPEQLFSLVDISAKFCLGKMENEAVILAAAGPVRDVFLLVTLFTLSRRPESLLECAECGKVFYRRDKRQKFCERRCTNLAGAKRYARKNAQKKAKKGRKK